MAQEKKKKKKIEIIGIDEEKILALGKIVISQKGDIYHIYKMGRKDDMHLSRHASGKMHWKSRKREFFHEASKRYPITKLKDIEFLGTTAIPVDNLLKRYSEFKMKKGKAIIVIDLKPYKKRKLLNIVVAILNEKGLSKFYKSFENHSERQIYLYGESSPMVGIIVVGGKE